MRKIIYGHHWGNAKNPRLRELAEKQAYLDDPEMYCAEDEHEGTIGVVFGSTPATLTLGYIDSEAERLFAFGHCGILAWELHRATGLPLAVFTSPKGSVAGRAGWSGHAALQLGPDRFLDITGVESSAAYAERYASLDGSFQVMEPAAYAALVCSDSPENPKDYLCELEQLVLDHFVALVLETYRDEIQRTQAECSSAP